MGERRPVVMELVLAGLSWNLPDSAAGALPAERESFEGGDGLLGCKCNGGGRRRRRQSPAGAGGRGGRGGGVVVGRGGRAGSEGSTSP